MTSQRRAFISYSSQDNGFVGRLVDDLRAAHVDIWLDRIELQVGDSLTQQIENGINGSSWLVAVISNHSIASPWVQQEINAGFTRELSQNDVFILPVILDDCEIPLFLRDKVFADFRESYEAGFRLLLDRLGTGTEARGELEYTTIGAANLYDDWVLFNTNRNAHASVFQVLADDGQLSLYLRSCGIESVGVNYSCRILRGVVTFYYKVISGNAVDRNLYFAMIPMEETGPHRSGYVEVGCEGDNAHRINYRRECFIPSEHYSSEGWHRGAVEFDFRETPRAFYSIFAPRINEACPRKGPAEFIIRDISVYS